MRRVLWFVQLRLIGGRYSGVLTLSEKRGPPRVEGSGAAGRTNLSKRFPAGVDINGKNDHAMILLAGNP